MKMELSYGTRERRDALLGRSGGFSGESTGLRR